MHTSFRKGRPACKGKPAPLRGAAPRGAGASAGSFAAYKKGVPRKGARRRGQSPPTHGNLFRQLETNFVNTFVKTFAQAKPRFCAAQHNLRASASAGECGARSERCALQSAPQRAEPSHSRKFVSSARNKFREYFCKNFRASKTTLLRRATQFARERLSG